MMTYAPLWKTMKKKGFTQYTLVRYHSIDPALMHRLRHDLPTRSTTLENLCRILDCNVEDIIQYVPDPPKDDKNDKAEKN